MSEHRFKIGDRVEAKDHFDKWRPAVVIYTDGSDCPYHVHFEDGACEVGWKVASNVRRRSDEATRRSNGSVTQRLRRELDAKSEENEKLQDQIQRLCKQVEDLVRERDNAIRDREISLAAVVDVRSSHGGKSNDTRVLDCIQALLGLRGER